jgi:hypothetical protein
MKSYLKFLVIILTFSISCEKRNDLDGRYGVLTGVIVNEFGQPIEGALIEIDSETRKTDHKGLYTFKELPVSDYRVTAFKDGFIAKIKDIKIIENKINNLDFKLESGKSFLEISDSAFNITSVKKNIKIQISSNSGWKLNETPEWIQILSGSGEGNGEISIVCIENTGDIIRTDTIIISSGAISRRLIINQDFPVKLIINEGIIGNGELGIHDSVYLLFNKPIQIKHIKSNWEFCVSDIKYKQVDNDRGVMFSFSCADLGGTYPFTIEVQDNSGQILIKDFEVQYFTDRIKIEGQITCYKFIDYENRGWISTRIPNRLIEIALDSFKITRIIDLDFNPWSFVINPYNNLLYILSGYPYENIRDNRIYAYNQQSGLLEKSISFEPEVGEYPPYANIYPYSIGFTKSGYGVVLLEGGGGDWKIIDSSNDDTTYLHNDNGSGPYEYMYFNKVHMNYDYSKLLLTERYGSCNIVILDELTHEFENLRPGSLTRGVFITPNRKNNKIYVGQIYDQFIIDLDGTLSKISYLDNRFDGSADFNYNSGEEGLVYFCDKDYIRLLDYNNSSTLMWCDAIYSLRELTASLDGNYTYAYKYIFDSPDSYFYRFDAGIFYRYLK